MELLAKFSVTALVAFLGVETLAGEVNWSSTITLGSIIVGILLGLSGLAVFGYGVKWKTAYETEKAVASSLRDGREAFKLRGDRLEGELADCRTRETELTEQLVEAKSEMARLKERPDLDRVLQIIGEQSVREDAAAELRVEAAVERLRQLFTDALKTHDTAARDRQNEIIGLLQRRQNERPS